MSVAPLPTWRSLWLAVTLAALGVGAGETTVSPSSLEPRSLTATGAATSATPIPTITQASLEAARRFREDFGLRSDEAWLLTVASDPDADRDAFGIPLTQDELRELRDRLTSIDEIREAVIGYGEAHPEDWAGAWLDHDAGGVLVAQFAGNVDVHRVALQSLVVPRSPLRVQGVHWSLEDLNRLFDRIRIDDPWFATIPAIVTGVGPNIVSNRFELELSAADPRAEDLVRDHFGLGPDILYLDWDKTGALLLGLGRLRVTAVDTAGVPVPGLRCIAFPDATHAWDPFQWQVPITDVAGRCQMQLPATGYWVHLETKEEGRPAIFIALGRAVVREGELTEVTIEVP